MTLVRGNIGGLILIIIDGQMLRLADLKRFLGFEQCIGIKWKLLWTPGSESDLNSWYLSDY